MEKLFDFMSQDVKVGIVIIFACCIFAIIAPLFDMWTAIEAVKAKGGKMMSHPMQRTEKKIIDYIRLILFVLMIDILGLLCFPFYKIPYCAVLITICILVREGLSIKENYEMKKSGTEEVFGIAERIIQCTDKEDAKKILESIYKESQLKQKEERNKYGNDK